MNALCPQSTLSYLAGLLLFFSYNRAPKNDGKIPIPVMGKVVKTIHTQPNKALPAAFKDAAIADIQHLARNGNQWFGTWGGGVFDCPKIYLGDKNYTFLFLSFRTLLINDLIFVYTIIHELIVHLRMRLVLGGVENLWTWARPRPQKNQNRSVDYLSKDFIFSRTKVLLQVGGFAKPPTI